MSPAGEAAPLRVLLVTPKAVLGGAERWLLSLLEHSDRVAACVVVLDDGPLVTVLGARGVEVHAIPTGTSGAELLRTALRLRRIIQRVRPDVVVGNGIKPSLVLLATTVPTGVPLCWVRHDTRFSDTLGTLIGHLADASVFVAPPTDEERHRLDPRYLPPPVPAEPLPAGSARARLTELGMPDDHALLVGMFTRLVPQKGVDTAIRALPGAPGWRLVVAGTADAAEAGEAQRLQLLSAEVGVSDRVSFLGHVEGAGRLAGAFDAIAILTRPGGVGYPAAEGFPLSLIEAAAAGVPVIGDPRRIPPFALPEVAVATVAVDSDDHLDVARALRELHDGRYRAEVAQASRVLGSQHPRPSDTAAALVDILADLAFRPGAGMVEGPDLSVVSTVKDEGLQAELLVRRLLEQARDGDEIVIVDGGSDDDTVPRLQALAAADARLRVVSAPGCGISEGRNIGITRAESQWIACTDAGCVPGPSWLSSLRAAAASGRGDLITGTYRASFGLGRPWEIALAHVAYPDPEDLRRRTPLVKTYGRVFGRAYDATLPTGRSVAFTRQVWQAAGGFPEDLPTAEDVMFGQNAVHQGARAVLCADACVEWEQRPTLKSNARMFFGYGHGDGLSGDKRLISRDLLRAAMYTIGPVMLARRTSRPVALAAAAAYLSLPLARAARGPRPIAATALVPVVTAVRDLAKAAGCIGGLYDRRHA